MGREKQEYRLRTIGDVYYYKLPSMKNFKSTGQRTKARAQSFILDLIASQKETGKPGIDASDKTFRQYAKYFFDYNKCPRVNRLRAEGKDLTKRYCDEARSVLVNYVFKSRFANLKMKNIRRSDVLDLRAQLLKMTTPGRVNDIITIVGIVFSEAVYREDILYNPVAKTSKLKTEKKEITPYSDEDYRKMFDYRDWQKMIKIWGSYADFIFEFIECNTGMRNGEVRCLKWRNVDFKNNVIYVVEAFKDQQSKITGPPKNGKKRVAAMCEELKEALLLYKEKFAIHKLDSDYVCSILNGRPFAYTRNRRHHNQGLINAGVEHRGHHTYRHTFNSNLMAGNDVKDSDIRLSTGWSDERIQDNYTHNEMNAARNVSEAQNHYWEKIQSA